MRFRARVLDSGHAMRWVQVEALDLADAQRQVVQQGLRALQIRPASPWAGSLAPRQHFPVLPFAQELLALLNAGLSVIEAVEGLLDKEAHPRHRTVLQRLQDGLRQGLRLSDALREQATQFPPLFIGMVQAAERTSGLPEALRRYVDYQQQLNTVRGRLISASIYPAILLLVGMGVALFLLGYVVPRFAGVYQSGGRPLPWTSALLLDWGHFIAAHAVAFPLALLALILVAAWWARRRGGAGLLLAWARRVPWVGQRLHMMELSRVCLTLGLLLEGGMSIAQALQLAGSVGSPSSRAALERVRGQVVQGLPLSVAMQQQGLATLLSTRMLRVGEASGQLGSMLRQTAQFYEGEAARWVERFSKAFEPLLMVAIGVTIGAIVLMLYLPIFDLAGSFQ